MLYLYDYVSFKLEHEPTKTYSSIIKEEKTFLEKTLGKKLSTFEKDYPLIKGMISNKKYKNLI